MKDSHASGKGLTSKLMPIYQGPYRITGVKYPNIVIESLNQPNHVEIIHVNRTKLFKDRQSEYLSATEKVMEEPNMQVDINKGTNEAKSKDIGKNFGAQTENSAINDQENN